MRCATVVCAALLHVFLAEAALAQSAGRSLDIQPGARQNGMGAAGVALLGDPSDAIWWNPAALGFAEWFSGQGTFSKLLPGRIDKIHYYHGAVAVPLGIGGVGVGLTYLSYGPSEGVDDLGNSTGSFTPHELSPSVSAGFHVIPAVAVGATVKYLRIKLGTGAGGSTNAVAVDLGCLARASVDPMTLSAGLAVQNLGPDVTFENEDQSYPLGRNLRAGVAGTLSHRFEPDGFEIGGSAAVDFNQSLVTSDFRTWHAGVEAYGAYERVFRAVLRVGHYNDEQGEIEDVTYGGGFRIYGVSADIASIPQSPLLDRRVVRFTIGFHADALTNPTASP